MHACWQSDAFSFVFHAEQHLPILYAARQCLFLDADFFSPQNGSYVEIISFMRGTCACFRASRASSQRAGGRASRQWWRTARWFSLLYRSISNDSRQQERFLKSPLKTTHQLQRVSICKSAAGCCHCSGCWVSVWWAQSRKRARSVTRCSPRASLRLVRVRAPSLLRGSWRVREGEVLQVKRPQSFVFPFINTERYHTHNV